MPTVELNRGVIEKRIGKKLSTEELKEAITYLGTDLEEVTKDIIKVEIFPNRPDLLSEQGLGRALASYLGKKGLSKYTIKKSGEKVIVEKSVKKYRPFTACAIVKGLKFDDEKIKEIVQIQEKLHVTYGRNRKKVAIGVYPMERIKFPIKFIAEDPKKVKFLPLEATREMDGLQILSQHPTGREYGHLLEGMDKYPFFIDANGEVLSMPPIINSHSIGKIGEETKDVFIECSGFDQKILDRGLNMVVTALADMGGKIYSVELTNEHDDWKKQSPNLDPWKLKVDIDYVNKILGLKLSEKDVENYLGRMGFGYKKGTALVPAYRADILHPIDLVESIAIAYGYMNFKPEIPKCATIGRKDKVESLKTKCAEILIGLGLFEANTYCLVGNDEIMHENPVKLANSVAEGYDYMRDLILPSLLLVLKNNRNRTYPQGFFETGFTFEQGNSETKIVEGRNLAFTYADKNVDYTYSRQVLDYLLSNLGLEYEVKTASSNLLYLEGRFGEVFVNGKSLGFVGQINPEILEKFELEVPAVGFELDFLKLSKLV